MRALRLGDSEPRAHQYRAGVFAVDGLASRAVRRRRRRQGLRELALERLVERDDRALVVAAHEEEVDAGGVQHVTDEEQVFDERLMRRERRVDQPGDALAHHDIGSIVRGRPRSRDGPRSARRAEFSVGFGCRLQREIVGRGATSGHVLRSLWTSQHYTGGRGLLPHCSDRSEDHVDATCGCDTIDTCDAATSVIVAPARSAMLRWMAGGMTRSSVPTTAQLGMRLPRGAFGRRRRWRRA